MIRTTTTAETDLPLDAIWEELAENAAPYVGRWNRLISTTNWEKGKIICQWRETLVESEAAATEYSDEAWSRLVGGVTGQHVGRLRRVYQRFGDEYDKYEGVYWSHFQAALDWDDAEMWLEGAVQNGWSVSQMRRQRWEAHGAPEDLKPRESEVLAAEIDEDYSPEAAAAPRAVSEAAGIEHDSHGDGGAEATAAETPPGAGDAADEPLAATEREPAAAQAGPAPFESLPQLPDDVTEAFESFKLAILRHKADGWSEISLDDLLSTLTALKELALAPSGDDGN